MRASYRSGGGYGANFMLKGPDSAAIPYTPLVLAFGYRPPLSGPTMIMQTLEPDGTPSGGGGVGISTGTVRVWAAWRSPTATKLGELYVFVEDALVWSKTDLLDPTSVIAQLRVGEIGEVGTGSIKFDDVRVEVCK